MAAPVFFASFRNPVVHFPSRTPVGRRRNPSDHFLQASRSICVRILLYYFMRIYTCSPPKPAYSQRGSLKRERYKRFVDRHSADPLFSFRSIGYLSETTILRPSADTSRSIFLSPIRPSNSYWRTFLLAEWLASI